MSESAILARARPLSIDSTMRVSGPREISVELNALFSTYASRSLRDSVEMRPRSSSRDEEAGRVQGGPSNRRTVDADEDAFVVELSRAGRSRSDAENTSQAFMNQAESSARSEGAKNEVPGQLSPEDEEEVQRLRARDAEVRAHENAHKAAAGQHARGGPSYEFERGPDGRRYAVGGEVSIDTSPVPNDPDATILKMRQVRRAALAPAEPSPQDRKVASEASQQESAARAEKLESQREARGSGSSLEQTTAQVGGRAPRSGRIDAYQMNSGIGAANERSGAAVRLGSRLDRTA